MNKLTYFTNLIKAMFRPNRFTGSKHIIKYAFTCGGVDYYQFDTTANLPYKRGLKCLSIYNEMDMKVDRHYLEQHVKAMEQALTGGKKIGLDELIKIRQLNAQLKERLEFVVQEDLVYKLASVVFFDKNENPEDWEWKYANDKIKHWKKHESAAAFFLREPIQKLIPFLNVSEENLNTYLTAVKAMDEAHLDNIYNMQSPKGNKDSLTFTQRYFAKEMQPN